MTLVEDLKRPFNLITTIIAIVGLMLSIYFYIKSEKESSLAYIVNSPASLIYNSGISSPNLKFYEQDSIPIDGNVYLITGTIWNSGDFNIDQLEVRVPITISLNSSNRILDYKITKEKDPGIAGFKLKKKNNNVLTLNWTYFDPGYGLNFQIIYVGGEDPGLKLNGKVLNIANFDKVDKIEQRSIKSKFILILGFAVNLFFTIFMSFKRTTGRVSKGFQLYWIICAVLLAFLLLLYIWMLFIRSSPDPI